MKQAISPRQWWLFLLFLQLVACITDISMDFSSNKTKVSVDININFTIQSALRIDQEIYIYLPFFTRQVTFGNQTNLNLDYGEVVLSPSTYFVAAWEEGKLNSQDFETNISSAKGTPFARSNLKLKMKSTAQTFDENGKLHDGIIANTVIELKIYKVNGIGAWCGFPDSVTFNDTYITDQKIMFPYRFETSYNDSATTQQYAITYFPQMGRGCASDANCNGHGACNYCLEMCVCNEGYGSKADVVMTGYVPPRDCSLRTCPPGRTIGLIPLTSNMTRPLAECSDRGICNRENGECQCFPPYSGSACERMRCPNDCSGHGQCLPMSEFVNVNNPIVDEEFRYGTASEYHTEAWDHNVIYGCKCDSTWEVGFSSGKRQLAEWFGPDCSQRHCPTGDNPYSPEDEQDCYKKNQFYKIGGLTSTDNSIPAELAAVGYHSVRLGEVGNYCHVDCANRGNCDYSTGTCTCYDGSWGDNCAQMAQGVSGGNYKQMTNKATNENKYYQGDDMH